MCHFQPAKWATPAKTKAATAAIPARSDLYVLGGQRATNNVPGMNDAKNKAQ